MTREQNRHDFPFVAQWLDALKAGGIEAKVQHAVNGGREVGERFEARCAREGHVPCAYLQNGPDRVKRVRGGV